MTTDTTTTLDNDTYQPTLTKLQTITDHTESIWCCCFSPINSNILTTCSTDKTIKLYKYNKNNKQYSYINELSHYHTRTVRNVCFNHSGTVLVSCGFDSLINIYQYEQSYDDNVTHNEYNHIHTLEGHESEVKCVAFNNSSTLLASVSRDKTIWIWSIQNNINDDIECLSVLNGHTADIKYVVWLDDNTLASASYDNTIRVWKDDIDTDDFTCIQFIGVNENELRNKQKTDTTDNDDNNTDIDNNNTDNNNIYHTSTVWCIAVNPQNNKQFVSCSADCSIILYNYNNNTKQYEAIQQVTMAHNRAIYSIAWSYDGQYIASAGADDTIVVYKVIQQHNDNDTTKPKLQIAYRHKHAHNNEINCIAWNKDNLLCTASDDQSVILWEFKP